MSQFTTLPNISLLKYDTINFLVNFTVQQFSWILEARVGGSWLVEKHYWNRDVTCKQNRQGCLAGLLINYCKQTSVMSHERCTV